MRAKTVDFDQREILIGVCGGVAAYKTAALVSNLVQHNAQVTVAMTESACRFVGPATFAALTGRPVSLRVFDENRFPLGAHIELADRAELFCVAPATANWIAKAVAGIADDLLSTLYLSFTGTILAAPAMNCEMWEKASVQRNISRLIEDGVVCIGPDAGWLSCRREGQGRMSAPEAIIVQIAERMDVALH